MNQFILSTLIVWRGPLFFLYFFHTLSCSLLNGTSSLGHEKYSYNYYIFLSQNRVIKPGGWQLRNGRKIKYLGSQTNFYWDKFGKINNFKQINKCRIEKVVFCAIYDHFNFFKVELYSPSNKFWSSHFLKINFRSTKNEIKSTSNRPLVELFIYLPLFAL